jgi:hypothetical protein
MKLIKPNVPNQSSAKHAKPTQPHHTIPKKRQRYTKYQKPTYQTQSIPSLMDNETQSIPSLMDNDIPVPYSESQDPHPDNKKDTEPCAQVSATNP